MAEPVIAREVAEGMVDSWASELGSRLGASEREHILSAVMDGRLDRSGDGFRYRLLKPVETKEGAGLEILEVAEPDAGQIRDSAKGNRDEMDTALHLISMCSGQGIGVVQKIKQRDFTLIAEVLGFFD